MVVTGGWEGALFTAKFQRTPTCLHDIVYYTMSSSLSPCSITVILISSSHIRITETVLVDVGTSYKHDAPGSIAAERGFRRIVVRSRSSSSARTRLDSGQRQSAALAGRGKRRRFFESFVATGVPGRSSSVGGGVRRPNF